MLRLHSLTLLLPVLLATLYAEHTTALAPTSGSVIELTDDTFDASVSSAPSSPWLIVMGAPWCPHCKAMEPIIKLLAEQLKGNTKVGKIDGTTQKVLLSRFQVEAFPTIFHINGTEMREYLEPRTLNKLLEFAQSGWRRVPPVAAYRSVTSTYGRLVGSVKMMPRKSQRLYRRLHEHWGVSNLSILALLLLLPLSGGLMCICILDHVYTRRSVQQSRAAAHVHYE